MGAIATSTMILPGISGAFVVLLFGQLEFMYGAVANIAQKWPYLLTFTAGSIIGLLAFARLLSYLLKKYHSYTLFILTGIMLGALYGPISDILPNLNGGLDIIIASVLALLGIAAIVFLHKLSD
jgi:putative membrane protein